MQVRFLAACSLTVLLGATFVEPAAARSPMRALPDGSIEIAGRSHRCDNVRTKLSERLPNLGVAMPDARLLLLNPVMLARETEVVQVFVFHHECGHHRVGGSELDADCWAVGRGVRDGWLQRGGLKSICDSFGGAPETSTHPSAKRRCGNLDRCFAAAQTTGPRQAAPLRPATAGADAGKGASVLLSGPFLLRNGTQR